MYARSLLILALLVSACTPSETIDVDGDGDGFPSRADCNDDDADIHPDAEEICDTLDNDCDGVVDLDAVTPPTWYADADGDGAGSDTVLVATCFAPDGFVDAGGDCDDGSALVFPGHQELCDNIDNDCNGEADFPGGESDADGDLALACEDCDDDNDAASPYIPEVCDGIDNDCDDDIDEASALGAPTWYADSDGDGFGLASTTLVACAQPVGYVPVSGDCDDLVAAAFPGATEICDGADNDCDGTTDGPGALGAMTYWGDVDGDGFGAAASPVIACAQPPDTATNDDDCDDSTGAVAPGAPESCNGVDDDCDGTIDDGASPLVTFYADADGDSYGSPTFTIAACAAPTGFVSNSDDCDDGEDTVYTGATELCDGLDNDCDTVLPADESDSDNDSTLPCNGDCDDNNAAASPNLVEVCDGVDNDCDTVIDNGVTSTTWYPDYDGDGYGNPGFPVVTCAPPAGYVTAGTDCNDLDASDAPGAPELCDGLDNDCDAVIDNGLAPLSPWYPDVDGDTYGDTALSVQACAQPPGYVAADGDCDDGDPLFSPAASELCTDGADNDCDTLADCADTTDCQASEPSCWECGNSIVDPGEDCDDGDIIPGDGCDELCLDEAGPIDLTGLYSSFPSGGRTVYFWKSDSNLSLNNVYDTWCEDHGLSWYVPVSSTDANTVITTAYNYDAWHTWIITKAPTGNGTWGGFPVTVDSAGCVDYSTSSWSGIRKWACSYCEPELYDQSRCWDGDHVYDWLVCEGP